MALLSPPLPLSAGHPPCTAPPISLQHVGLQIIDVNADKHVVGERQDGPRVKALLSSSDSLDQ